MQELKDTQSEADTRNISIDRVGVKGLRFPIQIQDKLNRIQSTVATVSLAVDLPEEFKGTHMSRFVEALHQHGPLLDVHTALSIPRELLGGFPPAVPMWKWNSPSSGPRRLPSRGGKA